MKSLQELRQLGVWVVYRISIGCIAGAALGAVLWVAFRATDGQAQRFSGMLTPAIALLAVAVALAQWWTARQKLQLDLFNRRFSVYEATIYAVGTVARRGSISRKELEEFIAATRGTKFLFDDAVEFYVNKITIHLDQVSKAAAVIESSHAGEDHPASLLLQLSHYRNWLGNEWEKGAVDAAFAKYMRLPS